MEKLTLEDIKTVLILGSGTLGLRIGLACALGGFNVKIYDIDERSIQSAKKIQKDITNYLVKKSIFSTIEVAKALELIEFTMDAEQAVSNVDLISESVTEDISIKRKVWQQFGKLCDPKTIFTTNTSSLLPSDFAKETGRPERFCAFHFHDVFHANVVDIMPNAITEDWIVDLLKDFGKRIQQLPVVVKKESPGYIFNAMLIATLGTAGALVVNGIASIEDVDKSWMGNYKLPIGPFGMMDEIGLDTVWHVVSGFKDKKSLNFAAFIKLYVDKGYLGVKSGKGFYSYPNPRFKDEGFLSL